MNEAAKRGLKRGLLIAAILLVTFAGWWFLLRPVAQPDPRESYAAAIGGPFTLTNTEGQPFGTDQLKGKPFAIFFGFTRCPDVCPTSLSRMAKLRRDLGADGDKFNIVFVSVDPKSDTPKGIGEYLTLFGTPIIGLTGTEPQLAAVKRAYGVYSAEVRQPDGSYLVDHTATIFLMGTNGEFVATLDAHEDDAPALQKLRRLVAGSGS